MSPRPSSPHRPWALAAWLAAWIAFAPAYAFAQSDTLVVDPGVPDAPIPNRLASGAEGLWYTVPWLGGTPEAIAAAAATSPKLDADVGAREQHTIVFDTARNRYLAFGGTIVPGGAVFNDVWARPAGTAAADWTPLAVTGTPPTARRGHTAVYDPIGDRMLVFGGTPPTENDVWELTLSGTPTWNPIAPTGTPPAARTGHSAVFDAARNRMIVFGGETPTLSNETWFLDCTTSPPHWQLAAAGGTLPDGRIEHVAVLDTGRDRMVVFGGFGATWYSDVWALSLGASPTWTRLSATSPPGGREASCGVYDATGGNLVLFGGRFFSTWYQDLWTLHFADMTWTRANTTGPAARFRAAMAIDVANRAAIVSGGESNAVASLLDTWALSLAPPAWTQLAPTPISPPPPPLPPFPPPSATATRYGASGIFDPVRSRYLMLGGAYDTGNLVNFLGDVAELVIGRDSTWIERASGFGVRFGHATVYDALRDRILVFGGFNGAYLNDVRAIQLGPSPASMTFTTLTAAGAPPSPRDFPAAVYDPVRDRVLVFGGNDGTPTFLNDLWELQLTGGPVWHPLVATGTRPSGRFADCAVYDPYNDRLLVGFGYGGSNLGDLWSLSLSGTPAWTRLTPTGAAPDPRYNASLVLDPNRQRVVLFGGNAFGGARYGDAWALPLNQPGVQWQRLLPGGAVAPIARYAHLALVDPVNDRMLVSGGYSQPGTLADVWRLQWFTDVATPTACALLTSDATSDEVVLKWALSGDAATFARLERRDATSDWRTIESGACSGSSVTFVDRDVVAGGRYAYRVTAIAGRDVSTSSEVWIDVPAGPAFGLTGFSPNPSAREARVAFSLPDRRPATIEVVDVGGRHVAARRLESPTPGAQSIAISPEGGLSPGLYFVKLTQGPRTSTVRGTIVR